MMKRMKRAAAIIIGLSVGLCAVQAMARNGQYLFREMARYGVPSGAAAPTATFLWHFDEAAGSTNVSDSGSLGLTMVVSNNAKTATSPAKFGNSMIFGAANDNNHILIPYNAAYNMGTNNWSFDMWVTTTNAPDTLDNASLTIAGGATPQNKWPFLNIQKQNYDARWFFKLSSNGTDQSTILTVNMGPAISNQWLHIAVFRYTNVFHIATNGIIGWRSSASGWSFSSTNNVGISLGEYKSFAGTLRGAWDEVRLCIGANMPYRGTNFVPPTAPYTGYE